MDLLYVLPSLLLSGFTLDFRFYGYYYICCSYPALPLYSIPPVSCSYLIIPWVLPVWYQLFYIYLLLHAYAHDTVFNAWLWFGFIVTRVLTYARHLAFVSPLAWGVQSDSPGSSCPGNGAWSVWIPPVADQSGAAEAWIPSRQSELYPSRLPVRLSSFPFVNSWVLVYCSYLYISL